MSSFGVRRAELEAQERERLRLEQVRSECAALLAACNEEMAAIRDPSVQQLAAPALREVRETLEAARAQVAATPDAALTAARSAQQRLHGAIAAGEAKARKWSAEQQRAQAELAASKLEARVLKEVGKGAAGATMQATDTALAEASQLLADNKTAAAAQVLARANQGLQVSRQAALDESVRKVVVGSLLATLREQGFQVEKPQLFAGEKPGGQVTLVGHLPSGRRARFDVHLDGQLGFDLDGYEGRACAREIEAVEEALRTRFRIQLGPPQITWKNPDKLSQGARDLPSGGATRTKTS